MNRIIESHHDWLQSVAGLAAGGASSDSSGMRRFKQVYERSPIWISAGRVRLRQGQLPPAARSPTLGPRRWTPSPGIRRPPAASPRRGLPEVDFRLVLAAIVLLALVVRLVAIDSRLHVDDAYTWLVARQPTPSPFCASSRPPRTRRRSGICSSPRCRSITSSGCACPPSWPAPLWPRCSPSRCAARSALRRRCWPRSLSPWTRF